MTRHPEVINPADNGISSHIDSGFRFGEHGTLSIPGTTYSGGKYGQGVVFKLIPQ
jgi:hypothetical protein